MNALYGIKVVPHEWQDTMPLPFDKAAHDASKIQEGTRILVYKQGEGIVCEGEVRSYFLRPHEWARQSTDDLPDSLADADYLLPLSLIYTREDAIAPDAVRKALYDPHFPDRASWRALDSDTYRRLNNFPE